jgi:hypothetical protein
MNIWIDHFIYIASFGVFEDTNLAIFSIFPEKLTAGNLILILAAEISALAAIFAVGFLLNKLAKYLPFLKIKDNPNLKYLKFPYFLIAAPLFLVPMITSVIVFFIGYQPTRFNLKWSIFLVLGVRVASVFWTLA